MTIVHLLSDDRIDEILCAWGDYRRMECEQECGQQGSPYSPAGGRSGAVCPGDLHLAIAIMGLMRSRYDSAYRVLRARYRDLECDSVTEARRLIAARVFARLWLDLCPGGSTAFPVDNSVRLG